MNRDLPLLSVVMTAANDAAGLTAALQAIVASDLPRNRWELIVVDDGASDESSLIAARYADAVVRLPGARRGPAYGRNRGAEIAQAGWIVFVSHEVHVRPDALRRLAAGFGTHPDVAAISGVFVPSQAASLAASYRAARMRFADEKMRTDASGFSPEFGAIRREAFMQAGMWDEWSTHRPRSEASGIGSRLRALGYRLVVDPGVEAEHGQEWNAVSVLAADLRDPGLQLLPVAVAPESRPRRGARAGQTMEVSTVIMLAFAVVTSVVAGATERGVLFGVAAVAVLLTLLVDGAFYRVLCRYRGIRFTVSVIPLHLASSFAGGVSALFGWLSRHVVGDPRPHPAVEAFAEIGVNTWPPVPRRRLPEREPVR